MEISKTILVVDDDPLIRKLVQLSLADQPYRVLEAQDGKEAREKMDRLPVDLLVTDYNMPDISGIELIQAERRRRTLPAILITGNLEELSLKEDDETKIQRKPFDPMQLIANIRTLCPAKSPDRRTTSVHRS